MKNFLIWLVDQSILAAFVFVLLVVPQLLATAAK